ncbi:MAG: hypothetical protein Kow0031_41020 [Anaerolineae bacterium]
MMAYCAQPWISPHTYRKLFNSPFLQPDAVTPAEPLLASFQPQLEVADNGTLLVSGLIYPNGDVARPEIIKLASDALGSAAAFAAPVELNTPPGDDYCVHVFDAADSLLAEQCFEAGFEDVETGQPTDPAPYFFSLPGLNLADVARVAINRQQVEQASVTASQHPPQVSFSAPAPGQTFAGEQTLRWDAFDPDGDRLQFDLLYSTDAGASWLPLALGLRDTEYALAPGQLPAVAEVWLRLIAGDGFNSATADLAGPVRLEREATAGGISLVGPATVQPGQPFEVQVVARNVAEPGLFGAQFTLAFDATLAQLALVRANPAFELVLSDAAPQESGRYTFIASRRGPVGNLTGDITLATLQFEAGIQPGQQTMTLHNVAAAAKDGVAVPISATDGLSLAVR